MPIGRPTLLEEEDLTTELLKRLAAVKPGRLLFKVSHDPIDRTKVESILMPVPWTQGLQNAAFDLKRMGLTCLVLNDAFISIIHFMNAKFNGHLVQVERLRPTEQKAEGDVLVTANQPRRLLLRYADLGLIPVEVKDKEKEEAAGPILAEGEASAV